MGNDFEQNNPVDWDRETYADWIWRGLMAYYASSNWMDAFDPFHILVTRQNSISGGLAYFYKDFVPENDKLHFRQAIGDVLRNHANNDNAPLDAIKDLISLISRIEATESLDALIPSIGVGYLGYKYPELLYETVATLKTLATSDSAFKTAQNLIYSRNFDDGYLFEMIKVLVESKPHEAADIVLQLEPRLTKLHQKTLGLGGEEWDAFQYAAKNWANHIMKITPIIWFIDLWNKAAHSQSQFWLFKTLFFNERVPMELDLQETNKIFINGIPFSLKISNIRKDRTVSEIETIVSERNVQKGLSNPETESFLQSTVASHKGNAVIKPSGSVLKSVGKVISHAKPSFKSEFAAVPG